jgi:hypothetical protein
VNLSGLTGSISIIATVIVQRRLRPRTFAVSA